MNYCYFCSTAIPQPYEYCKACGTKFKASSATTYSPHSWNDKHVLIERLATLGLFASTILLAASYQPTNAPNSYIFEVITLIIMTTLPIALLIKGLIYLVQKNISLFRVWGACMFAAGLVHYYFLWWGVW